MEEAVAAALLRKLIVTGFSGFVDEAETVLTVVNTVALADEERDLVRTLLMEPEPE